jgi:hypothetical protein
MTDSSLCCLTALTLSDSVLSEPEGGSSYAPRSEKFGARSQDRPVSSADSGRQATAESRAPRIATLTLSGTVLGLAEAVPGCATFETRQGTVEQETKADP